LEAKIDKESLGIRLLKEGYLQAYVDFFYLTNETTPSYIQPSEELVQEYQLKKREKKKLGHDKESLSDLHRNLTNGE
jgi:hypothetical protein